MIWLRTISFIFTFSVRVWPANRADVRVPFLSSHAMQQLHYETACPSSSHNASSLLFERGCVSNRFTITSNIFPSRHKCIFLHICRMKTTPAYQQFGTGFLFSSRDVLCTIGFDRSQNPFNLLLLRFLKKAALRIMPQLFSELSGRPTLTMRLVNAPPVLEPCTNYSVFTIYP